MLKTLLSIFVLTTSVFSTPAESAVLNIKVNPPRELDLKPLHQIFYVRKNMVNQYPILKTTNYDPSKSSAFNQVIPFKKWWGVKGMLCYGPGNLSTEGVSEESRFIDNPFALVSIEEGNSLRFMEKKGNCPSSYIKLTQLNFNTTTNTFTAIYNVSEHLKNVKNISPALLKHLSLSFTGINAVDFGFSYAHAINLKNLKFEKNPNISTGIYQFKDFIHVGNSCGYKGGCNNGSPYQPALIFKVEKFPANVTFNLWKEKPTSLNNPADIIYNITIK